MWEWGSCAVVETTPQIVGEEFCETLDLQARKTLLDVAAGNDNATLAAARRWDTVTSTDDGPVSLNPRNLRARTEGLTVLHKEVDAEALPFQDDAFDGMVSTFGKCAPATSGGRHDSWGGAAETSDWSAPATKQRNSSLQNSEGSWLPIFRSAAYPSCKCRHPGRHGDRLRFSNSCRSRRMRHRPMRRSARLWSRTPQGVRRQGACACAADRPNGGAVQRTVVVTAATGTSGKRQHDRCSDQPKSGFHVLPLGLVLVCPESVTRSIGDDNPGTLQERVMMVAAGP